VIPLPPDRPPRVTLDREEAAWALGIGVSTLDEWTASGFIPSIHRGKIRLYSIRALERWAEDVSAYEEGSRGKASVGNGVGLPADWGRTVGRRRGRTPTPIRGNRTGGAADAG